jgi:hypothetical protein
MAQKPEATGREILPIADIPSKGKMEPYCGVDLLAELTAEDGVAIEALDDY